MGSQNNRAPTRRAKKKKRCYRTCGAFVCAPTSALVNYNRGRKEGEAQNRKRGLQQTYLQMWEEGRRREGAAVGLTEGEGTCGANTLKREAQHEMASFQSLHDFCTSVTHLLHTHTHTSHQKKLQRRKRKQRGALIHIVLVLFSL